MAIIVFSREEMNEVMAAFVIADDGVYPHGRILNAALNIVEFDIFISYYVHYLHDFIR
jgi:hypothetical protein